MNFHFAPNIVHIAWKMYIEIQKCIAIDLNLPQDPDLKNITLYSPNIMKATKLFFQIKFSFSESYYLCHEVEKQT